MSRSSWRHVAVAAVLLLTTAPAAVAATVGSPTLVPPKVISPAPGAHIRAGTHVNFTVRTFPHDYYLWVHISKSPRVNKCGVIKSEVHTYDLQPKSRHSAVYRTHTTLYTFHGFWMATPGTYYWQAYRIEHHFNADGCIETKVMKLVITR